MYIYLDHPFSSADIKDNFVGTLDDIVPYMVGNCLYILLEGDRVKEIAADYYCHSRIYYSEDQEKVYISEKWKELPHSSNNWNYFQLMYFLNWDSTINGETYFKDLKYFCPTYKYVFDENGIHKEYMQVKDLASGNFHKALSITLRAVKQMNKKVGVMLSGGMDSTEMAVACREIGLDAKYYCANVTDVKMFDNLQDVTSAHTVAEGLGLDLVDAPCRISGFLNGWNGKLSDYVAFAYKDGKFWKAIAEKAKADGMDILLNGNHADYFFNFGFTSNDHATGITGIPYFKSMRTVTANDRLEEVFSKNETRNVLEEWNASNDEEITKERFLAWCITNGNNYPKYEGMAVDKAASDRGKSLYKRELTEIMAQLIHLYDEGIIRSARELVIEGEMAGGNVDGENTRAIMGACMANEIDAFILHASPLIYDASRKMIFDDKDIDTPKWESNQYLKNNAAFQLAQQRKETIERAGTCSASDVWRWVLNELNGEFDISKCTDHAMSQLQESGLFDIEALKKLCDSDIGVQLRVAWIGYIHLLYVQSGQRNENSINMK